MIRAGFDDDCYWAVLRRAVFGRQVLFKRRILVWIVSEATTPLRFPAPHSSTTDYTPAAAVRHRNCSASPTACSSRGCRISTDRSRAVSDNRWPAASQSLL